MQKIAMFRLDVYHGKKNIAKRQGLLATGRAR